MVGRVQGVQRVQRHLGGFAMPSCGHADAGGWGGLGSCNRGEDEPYHHVSNPAPLQSGELAPWVPLCLHSPGQDYGPGRGWKLWAKACPAALD